MLMTRVIGVTSDPKSGSKVLLLLSHFQHISSKPGKKLRFYLGKAYLSEAAEGYV